MAGRPGASRIVGAASPEHLTAETEPLHAYQKRLFWPAPFRNEVLSRLLALNTERAAGGRKS